MHKTHNHRITRAKEFGDLSTADHKVLNEEGESRSSDRYVASRAKQNLTRNKEQVTEVLRCECHSEGDLHKHFAERWQSQHPRRSETNGIAERAVHRVKEGASAILLQSALHEKWWQILQNVTAILRNVQDLSSNGKTSFERRFGEPSCGQIIPF